MRTQAVLGFILDKMSHTFNLSLSKSRRRFVGELLATLLALQGRATFANMARYSPFHERTFRRHFARGFAWPAFNLTLARLRLHPHEPRIGVFDTTFIDKAGTKTYGLDRFFSSKDGRNRPGLEVSLLGLVGTQSRHCIGLDATQTPPGLTTNEQTSAYSRADFYLEQITDLLAEADRLGRVDYWVGDGFYAKRKFIDALRTRQRHLITRLRSDANLRFLAAPGERGPTGRKRRYAGKVDFAVVQAHALGHGPLAGSRFEAVGTLPDLPHVRLYSAPVNSPHFKCDLRIVVLVDERDGTFVVLATSDLAQAAEEVVAFFRLRFQIELVIRDAKQHTGLGHCQARDEAKLDFHFNLSLAGVNLARLLSQQSGLSVRSYLRERYNRFLVARLRDELGLEAEFDFRHPGVQRVIQTGRIAA